MAKLNTFCLLAALLLGTTTTHAAVLISEVLYNEVGSAAGGEWIEIYNNGASSVDLSNYKIGDEEASGGTSGTEGMFQFPSGASIAPNEFQLVAADADVFMTNYGFLPTYEVSGMNDMVPNLGVYSAWDPDGGILNMSNSNDQAVLLDPSDNIADAVSWGNTFAFDPALDAAGESDGQSYERIDVTVDTDTAADWQLSNPSTPGAPAVPEPTSMVLLSLAILGAVSRRTR